ncbi:MAG: AAA family ATPase [Microcoleus sp. SU_5_6]|nr:AAA family ATPase [Microcoleus sp. SU_5_6]
MFLTLGIRLLGGFSLTYEDRPVTEITSRRAQALLAYLVLYRQTAQSRQRIAFHLWPESTDDRARAALRKELSHLRHALPNPDEFLRVETKTLQWLPDGKFILDVAEFEAAIKAAEKAVDRNTSRAKLEQAIELYQGDLLPDWEDEWVFAEREQLRQLYILALERLVNVSEEQQDYQAALAYARQMLRVDALNEATYGALIRLHRLNGDRAKALQVYHQCMTVLRDELGVDPSLETRRLYEQLLAEDDIPHRPAPSESNIVSPVFPNPPVLPSRSHLARSPLVGRDRDWASIQQWANAIILQGNRATIEDAGTSTGSQVLLLLGEPGIGKTRLLEELRSLTQPDRTWVLWGSGFVAEMMRPYGIWIDALRACAISSTANIPSELKFLLPELGQPSQASPDLSHLFDAVVQLLRQWVDRAPLLVLLDDIQWIDEASSALLHYAIRLLRPLPVLFAFAARTQELADNLAISRVLQALRREQRLQTLELHPLDREQTADLIRNTHAIAPSELSLSLVDRVFTDSGGNPLFALEMARALGQHQSTHADTVEALIRDRLHQLNDATREILPWAAALGRSFKLSTVACVADYPVTKLLTAIEQLEQQAIIRPGASLEKEIGYDFTHDIVRRVVYEQLSEPRRQLVHLQIAQKLHQQATPDNALASSIAHHASLGGDRALAASAALAAAERCLKLFAYGEALELAQQGIGHCQFLDRPKRILFHVEFLRVRATAGVTGDRAVQLENELQQLIHEASHWGCARQKQLHWKP